MAISPLLFVRLILFSLFFGAVLGVLHDVNRLLRLLVGAGRMGSTFSYLATIRLPIVGRPMGELKEGRLKRAMAEILTVLLDILWFVCAGAGTVLINYYFNDGKLRIYTVVALLVGFLLYRLTVGRLVTVFSEAIVFFIRAVILIGLSLITKPIAVFFRFFGKIVKKVGKKLAKSIAKKRKEVYNKYISKALLKEAEHGFLPKHKAKDV